MNVNEDLLGKTITGVIATRAHQGGHKEIWVLQFADGSHVEFVSPGARKALRRAAAGRDRVNRNNGREQAHLNPAANHANKRVMSGSGQPIRLADSRSMRFQRDPEAGVQLTLNVA